MDPIDKVQCITELETLFRHYDENMSTYSGLGPAEFRAAMIAHLDKTVGPTWKQNPLFQPLLQ